MEGKQDKDKFPEAIEGFLKGMAELLSWISKVALDTSDFIFRLTKQFFDTIFKIARTFVRWLARTIEATFKFIYKFFRLFWDIKKQILIYCCLYIPSLLLWIKGLKSLSRMWTTIVIIITIIMAFQRRRKYSKNSSH